MKRLTVLAALASVLMAAPITQAESCQPIASTSPDNKISLEDLKGEGEWRMNSMRFHMKLNFQADESMKSDRDFHQIEDLLKDFGGSATIKSDLNSMEVQPMANIESGFNAADFVSVECLNGVRNEKKVTGEGTGHTQTNTQTNNINGSIALPYTIDRSDLSASLENYMTLETKNREFPAGSVIQPVVRATSLYDLKTEIESVPNSPDLTARFWVEQINDTQVKVVLTVSAREAQTMNMNLSNSESRNGVEVFSQGRVVPVKGTLSYSFQAEAIYSAR